MITIKFKEMVEASWVALFNNKQFYSGRNMKIGQLLSLINTKTGEVVQTTVTSKQIVSTTPYESVNASKTKYCYGLNL